MMTRKFGKQTAIFILVFTIGCSNTVSVTKETLATTTLPSTPLATASPQSLVGPEDVFIRPEDGMTMVYVPGGEFQMGSTEAEIESAISLCNQHYSPCNRWYYNREGPQHVVTLSDFWLDQTEVSNDQYRLCVDAGVCAKPVTCKTREPTYNDLEKADHPVVCVNWEEAQGYCQWVGGRLPTEAEWEYAFRGAAGSIYPWGDEFDGSRLNYCDQNCSQSHADDHFDDGYPLTAPVGNFPSGISWSGAYNMSGNISEWVADWRGDYAPGAVSNPSGPENGSEKMLKGCSWFFSPAYCRGAARPSASPDTRFDFLGFRCAMSAKKETRKRETSMVLGSLVVPQGQIADLDGTIASGEWDDALVETFTDGSELLLMQDGEFLYVGIRANVTETIAGNVFIEHNNEISILHSSAALGTAHYQKDGEEWTQTQDFIWRCRNIGNSESAQVERAEFLQKEGWLAATGLEETPNELEYKIKTPDQDFRLAAVYIKSTPPYEKVSWPASLDDDCVKPTANGLPPVFEFSPDLWGVFQLTMVN